MEKFTWTEEYNTNIDSIDSQHQELFEKIDELALALYRGDSKYYTKEMIIFLEKYVENHFTLEEHLMKINDYHDFKTHHNEHESFRILYKNIMDDFMKRGGDTYLGIRIEKEVRKWWEGHVLKTDMLYVPYIKKFE